MTNDSLLYTFVSLFSIFPLVEDLKKNCYPLGTMEGGLQRSLAEHLAGRSCGCLLSDAFGGSRYGIGFSGDLADLQGPHEDGGESVRRLLFFNSHRSLNTQLATPALCLA